jgi:hypothetical protein
MNGDRMDRRSSRAAQQSREIEDNQEALRRSIAETGRLVSSPKTCSAATAASGKRTRRGKGFGRAGGSRAAGAAAAGRRIASHPGARPSRPLPA